MSVVTASSKREQRITVRTLVRHKRRGERFAMLTAYDFAFARIFDSASASAQESHREQDCV